jgi:hypothetical protein
MVKSRALLLRCFHEDLSMQFAYFWSKFGQIDFLLSFVERFSGRRFFSLHRVKPFPQSPNSVLCGQDNLFMVQNL